MNRNALKPIAIKAAIALCGLLAALIIVELGIRVAGLASTQYQRHRNSKALAALGTIRVMCVGDSMTANQYPLQLEALLNQNKLGLKFSVIDRALPATNSAFTVTRLEQDLDIYKPNIVIAMIGENDNAVFRIFDDKQPGSKSEGLLPSLRIFRLWHFFQDLLLKHKDHWASVSARRLPLKFGVPENNHSAESLPEDALKGNNPDAESKLLNFLSASPNNLTALGALGSYYYKTGRLAAAEKLFTHYLNIAPDNPEAMASMAEVLLENPSRHAQAKELLDKSLTLAPRIPHTLYLLGQYHMLMSDYDKAATTLERLRRLAPDYLPAKNSLGIAYSQIGIHELFSGHPDKACALLEKANKLRPNHIPILLHLAIANHHLKRASEALKASHAVLRLDPNNAMAYQQLCQLLAEKRDWPAYKNILEKLLESDIAQEPYGAQQCAENAYKEFKQYSWAEKIYSKALRAAPKDAFLKRSYAEFYKRGKPVGPPDITNSAQSAPAAADSKTYAPVTVALYNKIQQLLAERGIILIAMQYPARAIAPLERIFMDNSNIYYTDNSSFRTLAELNGYTKYFTDAYAGDFGHCTKEGNAILA
ncbi:MAG TPA: hypothetical protein PLL10_01755, partial [Elusimicrobiales bacterium]|nr:hypothetical protein [Elusimicrobiales bacterium]